MRWSKPIAQGGADGETMEDEGRGRGCVGCTSTGSLLGERNLVFLKGNGVREREIEYKVEKWDK